MNTLIKKVLLSNLSALIITFVFIAGCQQTKPDPSQELKPGTDKLIEVWDTGNLGELDAVIDPTFVRTSNTQPDVEGLDGLKKVVTFFRTAYPDFHITIDDEIYAENRASFRWKVTGTNTGQGEMPPTGKSIKVWGLTILHFANGKITREIVSYDEKSFSEQLGFTMMPMAAEKK